MSRDIIKIIMKKNYSQRGIALILTLFVIVILITLSCVFVLSTINEKRVTLREGYSSKAFYIAEAGSHFGLDKLNTFINEYMRETLNAMSSNSVENMFVDLSAPESEYDSLDFLMDNTLDGPTTIFSLSGSQAQHSIDATSLGDGTYATKISVSEKSPAVNVELAKWDFYYNYTIESTGLVQDSIITILLSGDFIVRVQKDSFSRYALFTNHQRTEAGSPVWFNNNTTFNGPVHTNDRFSFALNPSGIFNDVVTQAQQAARFYNNNFPILADANYNGTKDVPTFNDSFYRGQSAIALSSLTQKQEYIDQVDAGEVFVDVGTYLPNNGVNLTGGIYVKGDFDIALSVNGSNNAVYTIHRSGYSYEIVIDRGNNQTTITDIDSNVSTYQGIPDGADDIGTVIFVEGNIESLSGTIQEDALLTISAENNIQIQNNILYSDYTAAEGLPGDVDYVPPTAEGTNNLLGIVSWSGNVSIGTGAPDDINIHATILAKEGFFDVADFDDTVVGERGVATVLGGIISDGYGAFGTFNGSTGFIESGYSRNFVYDQRMSSGSNPPYFPTLDVYTALSSDITDKIVWSGGE